MACAGSVVYAGVHNLHIACCRSVVGAPRCAKHNCSAVAAEELCLHADVHELLHAIACAHPLTQTYATCSCTYVHNTRARACCFRPSPPLPSPRIDQTPPSSQPGDPNRTLTYTIVYKQGSNQVRPWSKTPLSNQESSRGH